MDFSLLMLRRGLDNEWKEKLFQQVDVLLSSRPKNFRTSWLTMSISSPSMMRESWTASSWTFKPMTFSTVIIYFTHLLTANGGIGS